MKQSTRNYPLQVRDNLICNVIQYSPALIPRTPGAPKHCGYCLYEQLSFFHCGNNPISLSSFLLSFLLFFFPYFFPSFFLRIQRRLFTSDIFDFNGTDVNPPQEGFTTVHVHSEREGQRFTPSSGIVKGVDADALKDGSYVNEEGHLYVRNSFVYNGGPLYIIHRRAIMYKEGPCV